MYAKAEREVCLELGDPYIKCKWCQAQRLHSKVLQSLCIKYERLQINDVGELIKLKVCENHPQGVVLVKFKDRKGAHAYIVNYIYGMWF
ncbi:hypothetical protein P8452_09114 [Trifolium repens]|nr:hypothetical protein P8452_09114 [Trifolium repens]